MKTIGRIFGWICVCLFFSMLWIMVPAMAKEEIVIGSHLPLSGSGAGFGYEQHWAYKQAVKDINKAGGIFVKEFGRKLPVRLIVMDDETNPRKASEMVTRLILHKKVDLILSGLNGSYGVIPGMMAAEKYKKYYHGCVIWSSDFLKYNFKWATMYFTDIGQTGAIAYEVWNSLPKEQRPKKPAVFVEDTDDGRQMAQGLTNLGEKYGYQIELQETLASGGKNFSRQISRAKSKGVDAILCLSNVTETISLVHQMKLMNCSVKFFQGWKGTWPAEFWQALGSSAQNILCDGFWSMDYPYPGAKELGERFYREHKIYSVGIGMYYALCQTLWQAVEKAGTLDSAKVRQAVLDNQFETVNGTVDYDERGIAIFPSASFQWRDGKQTVVYPFDLAPAKVEPMQPWSKR